jgi:DNA-binding NtrC family response regulator
MAPHRILVVDDDESLRRVIEFSLNNKGYDTVAVETGEKAVTTLRKSDYGLMVSDMKMPGMDGIELLEKARVIRPEMPVILITAFGTVEKAVEAIKLGAYDYITKPFDNDDFLHKVNLALEHSQLRDENLRLRSELESQYSFTNIIGTSEAMQRIFAIVKKVARSDATVLITGETGTGKELIARAIHQSSDRSLKPMITVNCAAIPRELLESELFGHVRGAFTGAIRDKTGKFVLANKGTIFLDEIGDMSLDLQAKLLRTLEDGKVEPVGSEDMIETDIRVLAATNRDLRSLVREGKFRDDLFYRLNVIPIDIPPLRERREDIPLLVYHFARKFSEKGDLDFDKKAFALLVNYVWPGNVRELENVIRRIAVMARGRKVKASDMPIEITSGRPATMEKGQVGNSASGTTLKENEKKLIIEALNKAGWNQTKAARLLDIPRHVLIYRMKKYDISEEKF